VAMAAVALVHSGVSIGGEIDQQVWSNDNSGDRESSWMNRRKVSSGEWGE